MLRSLWFCRISLLMVTGMFAGSCMRTATSPGRGKESYGKYSTGYPPWNASDDLERIARSVRKIYSVTTYTTFQFKRESAITGYHLKQGIFKKTAWGIITTNETVFGTATVIASSGDRVTLLTCAHVVSSPDTLITYFEPADGDPTRFIRSISIREKQENWVKDLTDCGSFSVLASDQEADIALLGKRCGFVPDTGLVLALTAGHAPELRLGSFVYILGYPMGNLTITQGVVSPAARRPQGEFTVDALLNKGFSGGILLAHRQGIPGFELVGMVKNVNMIREEFLKPATDHPQVPGWMPYNGELFVGSSDQIQYGLNSVIPMEAISDFYQRNRFFP